MNLDEGTIRHLLDNAGFNTVLQHLAVRALQTNTNAVGHEVRNRRQHNEADTTNPGHSVQRNLEEVCHVVVTTGKGNQQEEHDRSRADSGAGRNIARTLQQVVVCIVAGELLLQERVRHQQDDHEATQQGYPERGRNGVVADVELPCRHDTSNTVSPQHVDIWLGTSRNLGWVIRSKRPDCVDGQQTRHQRQYASNHHAHADSLSSEDRHNAHTNHVVLCTAWSRELGVLLEPNHNQVGCNQAKDDARNNQNVQDVETIQHQVRREVTAKDCPVQPGADNRQAQDDGGHDSQTNTGKQVVRQGVTKEALDHAQQDKCATDNPVCLTRTTECAGEEDAQHVRNHGHHEQQSCPVVHLAYEQATTNFEGDIQRGGVCAGHFYTIKRCVGAVVNDLGDGRVEEQRQVDTGQYKNDEAV